MSDRNQQHRHSFPRATWCALLGIVSLLRNERNPRIQVVLGIVTIAMSIWLRIAAIEWALVVLCIALVLSVEALNTAIERAVDHTSLERHPLAKQAKDIAAGAVLIAAVGSAIVGAIIFLPKLLDRFQ